MAYLVFALLFILPLFVFPLGKFYFEPPKVFLAEGLIDLLLFWTVLQKGFSWKKYSGQHLLLAGSILALSIIYLIFFRTPTSFFGNAFRLQGIFLLWHLLIWSIISSQISLKNLSSWLYPACLAALFLGVIIFGYNEEGRAVGSLGEPNALAASAIFFWPFIFLGNNFLGWKKKVIFSLSFLITLGIIFLSGSKAGILALFLQLLFLGMAHLKKNFLGWPTVICLVLLGFSLALPFWETEKVYENRAEIWSTSLIFGFSKPIFGFGFGNLEETFKNAGTTLNNNLQYQYIDSAHNLFLEWWLGAGGLGLVILGLLLLDTIRNFVQKKEKLELTCFFGLLAVLIFNPASVASLIAFWWLLGQGLRKEVY